MVPETDLPFRELVDAAPDGMLVCNQDGTLMLVNAEIERMFGYTADLMPQPSTPGVSPLAAPGSRQHKVIYIEDNPSNIAFMLDLIVDLPSVELLTAPTAKIGLELIRSHRPKVVIMDINLPGMSGFDAVERLHEWPETQHIPVIGLSAAALLKDTQRAKTARFYRYLTKPVKVAELTKSLEELLVEP